MQFALNKQNIIDLINKFTPDVTNQFSSNIANAYIQGSETEKKFFGEIEDYLEQNKFNIKKVTTDNNLKILITPEFLASIAMLTSQSTIGDQFYRYGINEDPTNTFFKDFYAAGFKPSEGITIIDPSKNATTIMKTVEEQFTYLVNNDKPLKATIKFSKHGHDGYKTDIDFSNDFKDEFPSESEDNQQQIAEALAFQAIGPLLSINSDPEHISINMNNVSDNLKTEILLACQRLCGLYGVTFKSPENQENVNFLQEEQTKLLVNHIEEESPQTIFLFPAVKDFDKDLYRLETDILSVDVAEMSDAWQTILQNSLNLYQTNYNETIQFSCGPKSKEKIATRLANLAITLNLKKTIKDNVAQVNQMLNDPNNDFDAALNKILITLRASQQAIDNANNTPGIDTHTRTAIEECDTYFKQHRTDTSTRILDEVWTACENATAEACTNNVAIDQFLDTVQSMVGYTGEEPLGKFIEFAREGEIWNLARSNLSSIQTLAENLSEIKKEDSSLSEDQTTEQKLKALQQQLHEFQTSFDKNWAQKPQFIQDLIDNLFYRCNEELKLFQHQARAALGGLIQNTAAVILGINFTKEDLDALIQNPNATLTQSHVTAYAPEHPIEGPRGPRYARGFLETIPGLTSKVNKALQDQQQYQDQYKALVTPGATLRFWNQVQDVLQQTKAKIDQCRNVLSTNYALDDNAEKQLSALQIVLKELQDTIHTGIRNSNAYLKKHQDDDK